MPSLSVSAAHQPLLLPLGGASDPVAAAFAIQAAATTAREAAVAAAMRAHTTALVASRHLPAAERLAARRAADAACVAAVDAAFDQVRATVAPPAPPSSVEPACSAGEVRFSHQFTVRLPGHAEPVKACADLRVHLGVPEVDRVTIFPAGTMFATLEPRSDAFRRALREIRGPEAGAIRRRAFELATADAELVEVIPTRFRDAPPAGQALADLSVAIDRAEAAR